eukprot:m.199005 g.199005  ORF g.199005 m.199005 type:complete len:366 (-) comp25158_c0_seq4:67-1164(-)
MSNAGTKETTDITPPDIQADEIRSGGADRRASRNGPISTRMSTHKRQQLLREAEPMGMDGGDSGVSLSDTSRDDDESEAENVPEQCEVKGGHTGTPHKARDVKPTGLTCDANAESNTSNTRSQLKWMRQGRLRTLPSPRYATLECKKEPKRQMKLAEILAISNPEDTAVSTFLSRMCVLSESTIAGYRRVYDMLSKNRTATLNAPQLCSALQTVCQNKVLGGEMDFVVELLDLLKGDGPFASDPIQTVNFEQFMMAAALSESIVNLSPEVRKMINCDDLAQQKSKAILMFFIDANEDCMLTLEDLSVLMDAGRIDEGQKQVVLGYLGEFGDSITFLQYLSHLPLFLQLHREIVENTLESGTRCLV